MTGQPFTVSKRNLGKSAPAAASKTAPGGSPRPTPVIDGTTGYDVLDASEGILHGVDERNQALDLVKLDLRSRQEFAREIKVAWTDAQKRFLLIGMYLIDAKERLPHGEYNDMIASDLPFDRTIAYQIRTVTEEVLARRLHPREIPPNYSTAYQITTLTDEELRLARQRELLRPNISRNAIISFKREVRANSAAERVRNLDRLRAERARLLERLHVIEAEIAAAERSTAGSTGSELAPADPEAMAGAAD